ncbi:MAG: glutamate--tRNA ligase [Phycisphaerales bacterium]|nr:glutamate--tRNA ligase [Phycisphaerales bacterium]
MTLITRFAPSPTGHLHIGGARTALFCWALARRHAGRFLLRIEDTDQKRSSESAARGILEDLAWLGIAWDEGPGFDADGRRLGGDPRAVGPFYQSQRLETYRRFAQDLIDRGLAYPAFDTPDELAALRKAAEAEKRTFTYRRSPGYDPARAIARRAAGEPCVIRFAMPPAPVRFRDEVLGEVTVPYEELDDFVILKADGFPTYHFGVVIDDELMGVTHILRGQEHLNNTPRHVALMSAMRHPDGAAFRVPAFAHLTIIANPDNSKMSKRDRDKAARARCKELGVGDLAGALARAAGSPAAHLRALDPSAFAQWITDKTRQLDHDALEDLARVIGITLPEVAVDDFRRSGYLPEAVLSYICLLGWNPGEKDAQGRDLERLDLAQLVAKFSLERVGKSASKFDRAKLLNFNQQSIAALPDDEFVRRWEAWARRDDPHALARLGAARLRAIAHAVKPRCRTLRDAAEVLRFALTADAELTFDPKAIAKACSVERAGALFRALADALRAAPDWSASALDAIVPEVAAAHGATPAQVAPLLRVAVTGTLVSPPLGDTLALLGRASTLARLDRCAAQIDRAGPG